MLFNIWYVCILRLFEMQCKRCIMGFSREWPLKPRGYLVSCPCVSQLKIVINFSPLYFTGRFTIFKYLPTFCWARAPILFGNDLSGSHLSYSKGFMRFGWHESPQKTIDFSNFSLVREASNLVRRLWYFWWTLFFSPKRDIFMG